MVQFKTVTLKNGLRVVVHRDINTPLAVVNVLYNVGSRDENDHKTGFAHLFEHLMFGGSTNATNFDHLMQVAGGENNAYTNCDMTNFYDILPNANLETALYLEADRMHNLLLNEKSLSIQQKVVVEEFHETCLNEPYGDAWHEILSLSYEKHPYQWPTIGKVPEHISMATLEDVNSFYNKYYHPSNAIISVCANRTEDELIELCKKYFEGIPAHKKVVNQYFEEPEQKQSHRKIIKRSVPNDSIFIAFHMDGRNTKNYYAADLLSDLLANGPSSLLNLKLVKEEEMFIYIDAYVTGSLDPGLFIIEGQLGDGKSLEEGEERIWEEIDNILNKGFSQSELDKQQNKVRTNLVMSETSVLTKAMSLAFYEHLGDANIINLEDDLYQSVTLKNVHNIAKKIFRKENSSTLFYEATQE